MLHAQDFWGVSNAAPNQAFFDAFTSWLKEWALFTSAQHKRLLVCCIMFRLFTKVKTVFILVSFNHLPWLYDSLFKTVIEGGDSDWIAKQTSWAWACINTDMPYSVLQYKKVSHNIYGSDKICSCWIEEVLLHIQFQIFNKWNMARAVWFTVQNSHWRGGFGMDSQES